jgi:two-component system, NtrC family, sensor histidine kinase PilS
MEPLEKQAVRLMVFRTVIAFTFFLSALGIQAFAGSEFNLWPFFYFTAFVLALNVLYSVFYLTFRGWRGRPSFIYLQMGGDILSVTVLAFLTGGINSIYTFLYHVLIVLGGFLLKRRGAFLVAMLDSVAYGLLCVALFYGWLDPERFSDHFSYDRPVASATLYALLAHYLGFFLVALLMSVMSERIESTRAALGIMEKDFSSLRMLNEQILSSLNWGVLTTDPQGRVTFANTAAMRMLGESIPSGWSFNGRLQELGCQGIDLDEEGLSRDREVDLVLGANRRFLRVAVAPLRSGLTSLGHLIFIRDQTEVVRLKEELALRERLAAMGAMAADIAHEIKNPLGSISGAAQMLQRQSSGESKEFALLGIIQEESRRLSSTLDNFLRFVKPAPLKKRSLDLRSLLEEVVTLFRNDPSIVGRLQVESALPAEPVQASVDPDQLRQALWNLLQNARKAISEGGHIDVSLTAEGETAILDVRDDGIGMRQSEIAEYFQPFRRGFAQGSGLGLSIVYRIIEQHGGTIRIESSLGKGTTCHITLPLEHRP